MYTVYKIYGEEGTFTKLGEFQSKEDARIFLHSRQQEEYQQRCLEEEVPVAANPDQEDYLTENYAIISDEAGNAWGVSHTGELWDAPDDAEMLSELLEG
jgi:hypothetical protein